MPLRDDQAAVLEQLREAVAERKTRVCLQAPTGWGKTVFASALVESARDKDKKVLFTVPAISLIDQTVEMFWDHGVVDVGVIQASHMMTNWSKPIQIASVQTLQKRDMPEADVVIVDECHRWFAAYGTWMHKDLGWKCPVVGLSATPWTKGLANHYDHFIRASTTEELIEKGLLSPYRVFAPTHPDLSGVRTVAGDYHEGELSAKMSDTALVADAVSTWLRMSEGRPTLCYAVDRAHAKHLQAKFQASGVPCGYQDAETKDIDRKAVKRDFHSGTVKVVVSVGTLTTGIDWDVRCISMCRPTKSDMLFTQIVGRGLRTAEGKDHCLILDHSSNHSRLGFVTDVDASHTGLLGGKSPTHDNRTESIRLPKECPQCAYLKPPRMAKCPHCGFVAEVVWTAKPVEGELRLLKPKPKQKALDHIDKATFYAQLRGVEIQRGYRSGWAGNQYRDQYGEWPSPDMRGVAPIMNTSKEILGWITSRQIAFRARKAKAKQLLGV